MKMLWIFLLVFAISVPVQAGSITQQALRACYEVSTRVAQVSCLDQKVVEARALLESADEDALVKAENLDQIAIFKDIDEPQNVLSYEASKEAFDTYLETECLRAQTWVDDPAAAHDVAAFCVIRLIESRVKRLEA